MVEYEQGDDMNIEAWKSVKFTLGMEFPNLPYLIDGDFKMSETIPIHKYIADKWMPEVAGKTAETKAHANMMGNILNELKNKITWPCYGSGDAAEVKANADAGLPKVVEFLGSKKFLTGDDVTWVDFYFVEMIELLSKQDEGLFDKYPTLKTYKESVFGLPKVAEYLASESCKEKTYTFNNKSAKLQYQS